MVTHTHRHAAARALRVVVPWSPRVTPQGMVGVTLLGLGGGSGAGRNSCALPPP